MDFDTKFAHDLFKITTAHVWMADEDDTRRIAFNLNLDQHNGYDEGFAIFQRGDGIAESVTTESVY
jgi:hypothetical protein